MGIKNLNRFILENCKKNTIIKKPLKIFTNKTVVIDTSIYMYKFVAQNALIENFYFMLILFKENKITPLFIFDGKPPPEKRELLRERSDLKRDAELKYNELKLELESADVPNELKNELALEMDCLKKQFVRIKWSDINLVKSLITSFGASYYEAPGEADRMCVEMVLNGEAWACLSDDMDMFVYGCPRVLRHLSLMNSTVLYYDLDKILAELNMSMTTFRQIMVVSGTDYNLSNTPNNIHNTRSLHETMQWFHEYLKNPYITSSVNFYDWLNANTKYITDYAELLRVYNMFCITPNDPTNQSFQPYLTSGNLNMDKLNGILAEDGFIFA